MPFCTAYDVARFARNPPLPPAATTRPPAAMMLLVQRACPLLGVKQTLRRTLRMLSSGAFCVWSFSWRALFSPLAWWPKV